MFCANCGKEISGEGKKFCPNCGAALAGAIQPPSEHSKKETPKWVYAVIAVLLILCTALAVKLLDSDNNSRNNGNTSLNGETVAPEPEEPSAEELLVGVWKGEMFDLTFTKDGKMRFSIEMVSLGGNLLYYEVLDEHTLYLSNEKLPGGITTSFKVTKFTLELQLGDATFYFSKTP